MQGTVVSHVRTEPKRVPDGGGAMRAAAVVVFYQPDAACFARANRLAQVIPVVVVDNTPGSNAAQRGELAQQIEYLPSGENEGIAAALNRGVACLRAKDYELALLLDQDSDPSSALIEGLLLAMSDLARDSRRKVAVAGPAYHDVRLGTVTPFVRFGKWRISRVPAQGHEPLEIDFLISSGSCIDLSAWQDIGSMDVQLFIDFVDVEWCVRARRAGYAVLGLPWLVLEHSLGDEPVTILGRRFAMHSAFRHYFIFRNALALALYRSYMPLSWKLWEVGKFPVRFIVYTLFSGQPRAQFAMICRGIRDGLRNRLGPLSRL
ncbi:rhamnosyltransferase [Caballeronia humi]|uniref:Rhamnosyltransferase n=2 Tax=Caballeronia humi TaxID=326474 RepID=A0A158IRG3_9BURK|nr:rhamnosyltransferase [Caballeronia humi]